jgi:hypothetical protein
LRSGTVRTIQAQQVHPLLKRGSNMPTEEQLKFRTEMLSRFEEFTAWAVANSPGIVSVDFDKCRQEITALAGRDFDMGARNAAIPEPSEDGPQYVSVSPAPWP